MGDGRLVDERGTVLSNEHMGRNLYLMKVESPGIACRLAPGQFVHLQLPGMGEHILRRPFSVYDTDPEEGTMDILYQVVGKGSSHMTSLVKGNVVSSIGPVGNGWCIPDGCRKALLVGGGVGAAPLFMLAKQLRDADIDMHVVLGAQTLEAMVCAARYGQVAGTHVVLATDDGTLGRAGFATGPAQELLDEGGFDYVACCGPEPLMRIVAGMAKEAGAACQVSLERRMACGVGACLSCVVDTPAGKRRCCVDGPVFDAQEVLW